jgi:hypothetical protein
MRCHILFDPNHFFLFVVWGFVGASKRLVLYIKISQLWPYWLC